MNTKYLCALVLFAAACSGTQTTGGPGKSDTLELKKAAAAGTTPSTGDVCATEAWYGDGVCDTFCSQADSDCVPDGNTTVCADFVISDGKCARPESDPCRFQDGDCAATDPGGDGVVCTAISESSDGVCTRPESDPCRSQDPDCSPPDENGGGTYCAAISEEPDGVCKRPATDPCRAQDPDCRTPGEGNGGDTGGCIAVIEQSNGKCERPASDPCRSIDPDCDVACAQYVESPDGVCKRDPNDPCITQDPDCKVK